MYFAQLGSTENRIQVTMFLHPIIYINSEVLGSDISQLYTLMKDKKNERGD